MWLALSHAPVWPASTVYPLWSDTSFVRAVVRPPQFVSQRMPKRPKDPHGSTLYEERFWPALTGRDWGFDWRCVVLSVKASALPPPFCVSPFRTARHSRLSGVSRPCSPSWLVGAAHPNLVLTPAGSMLDPAVVCSLAARVRVPPEQRVFAPSRRTTPGRDGCPAGGAGSFRGLHARDDQTWWYCSGHTDWLLEAGVDHDSAGP